MSLKTALFHSIDKQLDDIEWEGASLTTVTIHPSLAKAIELEGEEVPKWFNPKNFNKEHQHYSNVEIVVKEQDGLLHYYYE